MGISPVTEKFCKRCNLVIPTSQEYCRKCEVELKEIEENRIENNRRIL